MSFSDISARLKKKKDEEEMAMGPQPIPQDVLTGGVTSSTYPPFGPGPGHWSGDPRFQSPYHGGAIPPAGSAARWTCA